MKTVLVTDGCRSPKSAVSLAETLYVGRGVRATVLAIIYQRLFCVIIPSWPFQDS